MDGSKTMVRRNSYRGHDHETARWPLFPLAGLEEGWVCCVGLCRYLIAFDYPSVGGPPFVWEGSNIGAGKSHRIDKHLHGEGLDNESSAHGILHTHCEREVPSWAKFNWPSCHADMALLCISGHGIAESLNVTAFPVWCGVEISLGAK